MPLYNYRCDHCEGIFEEMRSVSSRHEETTCPYCQQTTQATPMMTGGHVATNVKHRWRPSSKVDELTGNVESSGPGKDPNARRTSVLHTCKGYHCSICKT